MSTVLAPFLDRDGVIVLDGGLATEFERRGVGLRDPLWSARVLVEQPELVEEVHLDYFRAGADVATTASYQATFAGLALRGLDERAAADVLRQSVTLARRARDRFWAEPAARVGRLPPLIAASVGSYGAFLANGAEFHGRYGLDEAALADFHRPRLAVLARSGADLIACETVPSLPEARALARVLAEIGTVQAWLSLSCRNEREICDGTPIAEAVAVAEACSQIVATGVNCTAPRFVEGLLTAARKATQKPLVAYPNRGGTWDDTRRAWIGDAYEPDFGALARRLRSAGARLIGGCCRTTPSDIRAIAAALSGRP